MANNDTIYRAPRAAALSNISTTETIFAKNSDSTSPAAVQFPGSSKLDGKPICFVVAGNVTMGTTSNVTIILKNGSNLTVASATTIATTGAIAVNTAGTSANYRLVFEGLADSNSKTLQGIFYGHVNGTAVAQTIHSAAVALDPSADASTSFVVSATFATASAGNTARLTDFYLEQM